MIPIFLILFIIFSADFASCEIYQWVDVHGGVHYTDDFMMVPEASRHNIKKIEEERQDPAQKDRDGALKAKESIDKDRLGRGEEYWKAQVEDWKSKMKSLQDRNEGLRVSYNELTARYNDSKNSVERAALRKERDRIKEEMEQNRRGIDAARTMLEKKIPEEAEFYKAKAEWIKQ